MTTTFVARALGYRFFATLLLVCCFTSTTSNPVYAQAEAPPTTPGAQAPGTTPPPVAPPADAAQTPAAQAPATSPGGKPGAAPPATTPDAKDSKVTPPTPASGWNFAAHKPAIACFAIAVLLFLAATAVMLYFAGKNPDSP